MIIGIDIDDTISNTFETSLGYAFLFNKEDLNKESNITSLKCDNHFYIKTIFKWSREEEIEYWKKYSIDIFSKVSIKPFAKEIINKLKDEGNKIILVTARVFGEEFGKEVNAEVLTRNWLDKHDIKYDELIITEDKKNIVVDKNIDVFIDDSVSNFRNMKDLNIKKMLMDSRMNLYEDIDEDVKRVYSWTQIYEEIKRGQ